MRVLGRSDAEILHILDLRDIGLTCSEIGERVGATKNAITGLIGRIRIDTEPSRHDRTMPNCWWRDGLKRQGGENAS